MTTTTSGLALSPLNIVAPSRMASSETSTPTTAVTPMTVTSEEPRRWLMPRRPVAVSAMVCFRNVMTYSP
jgi:hypothetical protein